MDGPRKASAVDGTAEPVELTYTGDRKMKLGPSPTVEDEAQTKIPGGGGTVKPIPAEELPS